MKKKDLYLNIFRIILGIILIVLGILESELFLRIAALLIGVLMIVTVIINLYHSKKRTENDDE
ncbi:MAG: hypothetical protein PHV06_05585 [bacterium]|nr:hypothetical protein [bacterium]